MINDDQIKEAAQAFAAVIKPDPRQRFVEDFEMGARWMRRKMRELYEQTPTTGPGPLPEDRAHQQQEEGAGTGKRYGALRENAS